MQMGGYDHDIQLFDFRNGIFLDKVNAHNDTITSLNISHRFVLKYK